MNAYEWIAVDSNGNQTSVFQDVSVLKESGEVCCPAGTQIVYGTEGQDMMTLAGPSCVFAKGGGDHIVTSSSPDFIFCGDGQDQVTGYDDGDVILGGEGADHIVPGYPSGGAVSFYGEAGNDSLQAIFASSSRIFGGEGADHIVGSNGSDYLAPGAGMDAVQAMDGDDLVVLWDVCEATAGKTLDGGPGFDTLQIPVSLSELQLYGVTVTGFENVIVVSNQTYLAECF